MKLLKQTLFLFLILSNIGNAQDMAKGFTNLEKENLIKLKYSSKTFLKDYPKKQNCLYYARAIGLNNQAEKH
jgi:hypothetical protein